MNKYYMYNLTCKTICLYGETTVSYGIAGKYVSVEDVSVCKSKVSEMVKRLNNEKLEESQLEYFIEDELDK